VCLFGAIEEFESAAKLVMHRLSAISDNIETAALFRASETERGNDDVAALLY